MIWLNWLCTCFVIKGLCVQILLGKKLELSFLLNFILAGEWRGMKTLVAKRGSLMNMKQPNKGSWLAINMKLNSNFRFSVNYT